MSPRANITIIGAGVVGLAIAARLASEYKEIYLLEKNDSFGQETSSRHSGVIHSGIYYPEGSLKARLCVAGNRMLYQLCEQHGIGHARLGKLIIATDEQETQKLQELWERGQRNGVRDLRMLPKQEIAELEPNVAGVAAILSPSTGIIDSHTLMRYFISKATTGGAQIAYRTKVVGIDRLTGGYKVTVADDTGTYSFNTRLVINCAGLHSDKVAALAGIDTTKEKYRLYYCKGEYFSAGSKNSKLVKRLIYPIPPPDLAGAGIHTSPDLDGRMRLGPSVRYVDSLDYSVDSQSREFFCSSVKRYLPSLDCREIEPEMAGIRPKLQEPGGEIKDFLIREESDKGLPGLINLIGIESPGLTASPAIAEYVSNLVAKALAK